MTSSDACWYIAYGSNMDPDALDRYLSDGEKASRSIKLTLDHALYYAGKSKTWGGSVAFLALSAHAGVQTPVRAFLLDVKALASIMRGENGQDITAQQVSEAIDTLAPGAHAQLELPADPSGFRSKYDTLLRLSDLEGFPAYSITTGKTLETGEPAPEYFRRIEQARLLP